jgi:protein-L-isoaspartate(D-aspartate) O-methyltransferase
MPRFFNEGIEDLVAGLRADGISDARVLDAVAATPREHFVDEHFRTEAFADRALPIGCGQTISQPYVVALMTQLLEVAPDSRVLEVGTGSGYQTAILARLAQKVYTLERHRPLLEQAETRFKALGLTNIAARYADGYQGWWEEAPFDRILVTAAFRELPDALAAQLTLGGILVTPLGYETISQRLWKIIRTQEGLQSEAGLPVVFVPMVPGLARGGGGFDDEDEQS